MGNQGLQGNCGNYNLGWNSHQSMGPARSSNRPPHQQNQQQQPSLHERTSKLEETLQQFMQVSIFNHKSTKALCVIWRLKWVNWHKS